MAKNVSVAMESPVNIKKQNARRKKMNNNKPKKQIASATDVRYFYPKTFEDMWPHRGFMEYKMSPEMINDVLTNRNKLDVKIDPQRYLCDYVNEQFGFINYCVRVIAG